jgi:predicted phage terminase large subunit-like protein
VWGCYLQAICEHLQAVREGRLRRLAITLPPNTLKSFLVSIAWPAWIWATDPSVRFLVASNDGPLATRDALAMRTLVESDWYAEHYRSVESHAGVWEIAEDQDVKTWFNTTRGGHRISYSVNARITGKKGDILIVDDANDARKVHSAAEREIVIRWHDDAFSGRMADERTTPEVIVGQRTHNDDLIGHCLKKPGWVELRLPEEFDPAKRCETPVGFADPRTMRGELLRPERFGLTEVADRVAVLGSAGFASQHNQDPRAATGKMFDRAKVRIIPDVPAGISAIRYWDTAASTSESACHTAGVLIGRGPTGRFAILDVVRGRWTPGERNETIKTTAHLDRQRQSVRMIETWIEQEPGGAGLEAVQRLIGDYLAGFNAKADKVTGDKTERAKPLSAQWEVGNVDLVDAPWNESYLVEMDEFPGGRQKDQVDASSGAFNKLAAMADGVPTSTAPPGRPSFRPLGRPTFGNRPTFRGR